MTSKIPCDSVALHRTEGKKMADWNAVDTQTLRLAANLIRTRLAGKDVEPLTRFARRDAADFLDKLAKDPEELRRALRPGNVGN